MAVSVYNVVLAIHIVGVVIAFGVTFAYPIMFALAARHDPRSLPLMHRIERLIDRALINGALVVVLGAGIYLATDGHHWKAFFVQWGIGAIVVIGALVGSVMIPTSKRAQEAAERDLAAAGGTAPAAGGVASAEGATLTMSAEYRRLARRLATVGSLLSLLVLATIFIMATKP
jgi:hypothetical protein